MFNIDDIKAFEIDNACIIDVDKIVFEPALIELCKMNSCGNYGKSWVCPPHVGNTEELIAKAKKYKKILVFQKIYAIEDSFDIEGMFEGNNDFRRVLEMVRDFSKTVDSDCLMLGAGGCKICDTCAIIENAPCRFPERAMPSLESYSIQVSSLAKECGMNYINGQNTVTYFGAILFN
ncbi:MAG: DUF2284 domain-containing protein [Oscillospiraceae bacterium]